MPTDTDQLLGGWRKEPAGPACAALYPALLRLEANGLYRGLTDPPGQFATWDVGTWRVEEAGRIAVSTANDAVVSYAYALSGSTLTFTDPAGCRFSYRRAP